MKEENFDNQQAAGDFDEFDLTQWDEDFIEAPVEDRDFDIPDGKYQVVVDRVELTKSQTSGNPMLKWKLKIIAPNHVGGLIWRNNVIASKSNVQWLKNDLHVCGLDLKKLSDLPASLEKLLDIKLEVTQKTKGENVNVYINRRIVTGDESNDIDRELQEEAEKVF